MEIFIIKKFLLILLFLRLCIGAYVKVAEIFS